MEDNDARQVLARLGRVSDRITERILQIVRGLMQERDQLLQEKLTAADALNALEVDTAQLDAQFQNAQEDLDKVSTVPESVQQLANENQYLKKKVDILQKSANATQDGS